MSINNIENQMPGQDKNMYSGGSKFFNENTGTYEGIDGSSSYFYDDNPERLAKKLFNGIIPNQGDTSFRDEYYVPLESVRMEVNESIFQHLNIIGQIEDLMSNINIDYSISPRLEETHKMLWKEVCKFNSVEIEDLIEEEKVYAGGSPTFDETTGKYISVEDYYPIHISFEEYLYALRSGSNVSRRLIKEYNKITSHSVFSYLLDLRNLSSFIINEGYEIKKILDSIFREEYEDDSQKQIGVQFDAWAKVALHNAKRISEIIISKPGELPPSEVDKVTQKQAIEFQAFFSIRLDAVNEEVENFLEVLKKDYTDHCEIFYKRYLKQALTFRKDISSPMELNFYTTALSSVVPTLASELVIATNVINANMGMILTDMIERNHIINSKIDSLLRLINNKRKYCNYIFQLSFKGAQKQKVVLNVISDPYVNVFKNSEYQLKYESDLLSNHASLAGLEEDHHPQYLLKDGGVVTGDISVLADVRIDGVHLSSHAHTGLDGSSKIKSTDIDYETPKNEPENQIPKPLSVGIDSFVSDIIDGGVPVMDLVLAIDTGSLPANTEYEIIIAEVE